MKHRVGVIIGVLLLAGSVAGVAFAAATPTPTSKPADAGVHGGPKPRFHDAAACNLTDISKLAGNWTHGDYVSAVAAGGDQAKIRDAAHSRCGKPMHAGGAGGADKAKNKADKAKNKAAKSAEKAKKTPDPDESEAPDDDDAPAASVTPSPK